MKISVATPTFARPTFLEEAIESFLQQDYADKEMVVLNTFDRQHIVFDHPQVKVINTYHRYGSLGETRNKCIERCSGEFILCLDDDDIILPHYLSWLAEHVTGREWVRQNHRFSLKNKRIGGIEEQATNCTLFSKAAWSRVGEYPEINSGEDKVFKQRLMGSCAGQRFACSPREIGFLYRWHGGNFSKHGRDQVGALTGWQHAKRLATKSMARKGKLVLRPRWALDYSKLARDWVKENRP